jgi:hypothetical protein
VKDGLTDKKEKMKTKAGEKEEAAAKAEEVALAKAAAPDKIIESDPSDVEEYFELLPERMKDMKEAKVKRKVVTAESYGQMFKKREVAYKVKIFSYQELREV